MTFCNWIRVSSFIIVIFSLSACFFDDKSKVEAPSTFDSEPIQLIQIEKLESNALGLPSKQTFHLKTCLFDKATGARRIGEDFQLNFAGKLVTAKKDLNGCIYWEEQIAFEPLAPANDITFSREVSGRQGKVRLAFSLDPWSGTFFDLRIAPHGLAIEESKAALALSGQGEFNPGVHLMSRYSNLIVDRVETELRNEGTESSVNKRQARITFFGGAFRIKHDQSADRLALNQGKMKIQAAILETKIGASKTNIWSSIEETEAEWKDGRLDAKLRFTLKSIHDQQSNAVLIYRIEPIAGSPMLLPAEGEILLTALVGRNAAPPRELPPDNSKNFPFMLTKKMESAAFPSIVISDYNVSFAGDEERQDYDPRTWIAKTDIKITACLTDPSTGERIGGHPFLVSFSDQEKYDESLAHIEISDNSGVPRKGCVFWNESLSYSFSLIKNEVVKYIHIKSNLPPYRGQPQTVRIEVNPSERGAQIFRDVPLQRNPQRMGLDSNRISAELDNIEYRLDGSDYQPDPRLSLTRLKKYNFSLKPYFLRKYSNHGQIKHPVISGTRFRVRGALLQNMATNPKTEDSDQVYQNGFLASFETETIANNKGQLIFTAVVPIDLSQEYRLDSMVKIILQLSPLGGGAIPTETIISDQFKGNSISEEKTEILASSKRTPLVPESLIRTKQVRKFSLNEGISYALALPWEKTPEEQFVRFWETFGKVNRVDISKGELPELTFLSGVEKETIRKALELPNSKALKGTEAILRGFCGTYSSTDDGDLKACQKAPLRFFQIASFHLIHEIENPKAEIENYEKLNYALGTQFIGQRGITEQDTEGDRRANEFGLGLVGNIRYEHFGSGGGLSAGFFHKKDYYRTIEVGAVGIAALRSTFTRNTFVTGALHALKFPAQVKKCLFIRPLAMIQTIHPNSSYLICSEAERMEVRESWYSLRESTSGGAPSGDDETDPRMHGWTKVIRGERNFDHFIATIQDGTRDRVFRLEKINLFQDGLESVLDPSFNDIKSRERLRSDGGVFPGIFDFHELTALKWTEPEITEASKWIEESKLKVTKESLRSNPNFLKRLRWYSRCMVETIAREYLKEDFNEKASEIKNGLMSDGTHHRCERFAKGAD